MQIRLLSRRSTASGNGMGARGDRRLGIKRAPGRGLCPRASYCAGISLPTPAFLCGPSCGTWAAAIATKIGTVGVSQHLRVRPEQGRHQQHTRKCADTFVQARYREIWAGSPASKQNIRTWGFIPKTSLNIMKRSRRVTMSRTKRTSLSSNSVDTSDPSGVSDAATLSSPQISGRVVSSRSGARDARPMVSPSSLEDPYMVRSTRGREEFRYSISASHGETRNALVGCSHATRETLFRAVYELERHRGALEILLFLGLGGPASMSKLRRRLFPGPEAFIGAARSLERLGFIVCEQDTQFPFSKIYKLTGKGSAVIDKGPVSWAEILVTQST